jgi:2-polyprenyl-3-methyl-5-hydroxy-6-metoxy-1,4-benzoquinol methylase
MSEQITDLNKSFWNKRADEHSFFVAGAPMKEQNPANPLIGRYRNRTEYKHLKRKINLKNKTLLDLGCGTGRLSFQFAKQCKKVVGIDFAESMISQAKNYATRHNIKNVEFFVSNLQNIEINGTFDIVYFGGVLMCIDDSDVKNIIKSISPLLDSDSVVVNRDTVSLLNTRMSSKDLKGRTDFTVYRTISEVEEIFKTTNYQTFYSSETYPFVLALNIYNRLSLNLQKKRIILWLLNIGLYFQSLILDPFLLKNKWIYKKQYNGWKNSSYPLRQFYFFHKILK